MKNTTKTRNAKQTEILEALALTGDLRFAGWDRGGKQSTLEGWTTTGGAVKVNRARKALDALVAAGEVVHVSRPSALGGRHDYYTAA